MFGGCCCQGNKNVWHQRQLLFNTIDPGDDEQFLKDIEIHKFSSRGCLEGVTGS